MVWFSFGSWFSCDDAREFKDAWLCSSKSAHGLIEFKLVELKVRLKKMGFFCQIMEWFCDETGLIVLMCENLKTYGFIDEKLVIV